MMGEKCVLDDVWQVVQGGTERTTCQVSADEQTSSKKGLQAAQPSLEILGFVLVLRRYNNRGKNISG